MKPYFELAKQYDYRVTTIIVENRHGAKSIHNVPPETIKKMTDRFEIKLAPDAEYTDFVKIKEQNGLFIHKYNRKVFYDNLWHVHPDLVEARGLIKDSLGNIVQYPFTKIFNRHENGVDIQLDQQVLAVDKINGFMAATTWYNGDILVSTTGSLESEFVSMAKELLPLDKMKDILQVYEDYTFCFEIVHPNDPHIIPEEVGAYLIGGREKSIGSGQLAQSTLDRIAFKIGVKRPTYKFTSFGDVVNTLKTYKREGFVVYDADNDVVLKLKSPYYLSSKFIARTKKLYLIFGKDYKQHFDEEFYGLCAVLRHTFNKEEFLEIPEQERLEIIRIWAEGTL
jgi:hypothetical protein